MRQLCEKATTHHPLSVFFTGTREELPVKSLMKTKLDTNTRNLNLSLEPVSLHR